MRPSARPVWFSMIFAALGLGVIPFNLPYAILWCCLWLGAAIFFVGGRRAFPAFVPLPPPASLAALGIPDAALGGALSNLWYLLTLLVPAWLSVVAVPLLAPESSLLGFGIGIALTLSGAAALLVRRQRASVKIARELLGNEKLRGVVYNDAIALRRQTFWFDIAGVHHGTAQVESVHGGYVTVATQTPTSNTYGYRQERREDLRLEVDGEPWIVDTHAAIWAAAPLLRLPSAPALEPGRLGEMSMGRAYVGSARAWEQEEIGRGYRVIACGIADPAAGRLRGDASRPVLLFGVDRDRDPAAVLRLELLHRRWPIAALLGLALLGLLVSLA